MKTFSKVMTSAAVATMLVVSASSYAQVRLNNVRIQANNNDVTTVASGRNAEARSRVGTISGSNVDARNVRITANNNDVTTRASGRDSKACSSVGAIDGGFGGSSGFLGIGGSGPNSAC